ncbi:uncharacterized protein LOC142991124 [Genypterus blacodes]|uniref:uncharacterized protein LOC142991124 n=1 Tax=Genypterus blacodes TaxID=154954 RepID=UPI003F7705B5
MSTVQMLRQRPTEAVGDQEEIRALEEELSLSQQENDRLRKRLFDALNPEVRLHRKELPLDAQQLFVQQKWSSSLDQQEPEHPHIKEEQEALWISQEKEQGHGLKESVKSEDDQVRVQSSQLHQCQSDENTEAEPPSSISTQNRDMQVQMEIHTGKKLHCCTVCGKNFNIHANLRQHLRIHTGERPYCCSVCGNNFTIHANLRRHMRIHEGVRQYCCSVCGNNFIRYEDLKVHMRIHTGEKPFICSLCGKDFTLQGNLKRHITSIHSRAERRQCCQNFTACKKLKVYTSIHTGEKQYCCSVCGQYFPHGSLMIHMRIHTGEKPHHCSVCGKNFNKSGTLTRHMRIHTGEKPFSCSVCDKTFNRNECLSLHMTKHTGERPFSCSVCGHNFARSGDLKNHMKIHSGVKPYSCSDCGKSYTSKGNLTLHMNKHALEKP